jgi:predicted O-methyltransferase YrrM
MGKVKVKEKKIPRNHIGSLANMRQVLENWKSVHPRVSIDSRRAWIEHYLKMKYNVYDHNIALVYLMKKLQPESYLEVGVLNGGSLVHAALAPSVKRIVGIDAWARGEYAGIPTSREFVRQEVAEKFADKDIALMKSLSQPALRKLAKQKVEKFDVATVDGDHSRAGAMKDLKLTLPLVKQAIVFDDILHHSHLYLTDVALEFAAENDLPITINYQTPGCVIFWVEK